MARKQPETKFKEKIFPILKLLPNSFYFSAQMKSIRGIPDIVGCINGVFVGLELKKNRAESRRKTGRTVLQGHRLIQIRNAGGYGEFVYPENWEEIHKELSAIANRSGALSSIARRP